MTFASFAPAVHANTGVSDYAARLDTELCLPDSARQFGQEAALYHLGNNSAHTEIYAAALARPGVVVLHDAALTHFLLGILDEREWVDEFVYNYGEWYRGFARQLWKDRAQSASDPLYFEYGMLRRICESARAVIVHNPAAARAVVRHTPNAKVVEIPHFFAGPAAPFNATPSHCLRVGVFGYLRETKRVPVVLRAVAKARRDGVALELVLAGSWASRDLERALSGVRITGHLSEDEFWRVAYSVDVCVNLRYPSAHETSGIGVSLMGIGKPVIFTAGEELARLPEDAYLSVEAGPDEENELAELLGWLAANREAARAIGRRAAEHIAREHALESVAARYRQVLLSANSSARSS